MPAWLTWFNWLLFCWLICYFFIVVVVVVLHTTTQRIFEQFVHLTDFNMFVLVRLLIHVSLFVLIHDGWMNECVEKMLACLPHLILFSSKPIMMIRHEAQDHDDRRRPQPVSQSVNKTKKEEEEVRAKEEEEKKESDKKISAIIVITSVALKCLKTGRFPMFCWQDCCCWSCSWSWS